MTASSDTPHSLQQLGAESLETPSALLEVIAEADQADGAPPISDQAILAARQGRRTVFGVHEGEQLVGVGLLGEGELDLVIRPSARGRGLGTAALHGMISAKDPAAAHAADGLKAWAHGENPAARALMSGAGFFPIRTLYRLALPTSELEAALANAREMPDGFRVISFDPSDDKLAEAWVQVNAAAFASHPEQGAVTLEDFRTLMAEPWFDPRDLRLAIDPRVDPGDEGDVAIAGYTWVKTTQVEMAEGRQGTETELYVLGVDPRFAGLGLGAGLMGETFRVMREHSPDRITLYVDGDNESALALYYRAGFVTDQVSTQWHAPASALEEHIRRSAG